MNANVIEIKLDERHMAEVDEYGSQDSAEKLAVKKKKISKTLLTTFIHNESTSAYRLVGNNYVINITAPSKESYITDKELLFKILKKKKFLELANFKLEDLRAWLKPDELEQLIKTFPGPRRWTAQQKCCEVE